MKYFVVEPFTLETQHGSATFAIGQVLELSQEQAAKLGGKVGPDDDSLLETYTKEKEPRNLPHYCEPATAWCSAKLPGKDYPAGCIRIQCEHHQENQA